MASTTDKTLEIVTQHLAILSELSSVAEVLAERSKSPDLDQVTRAALRNHAKLANEVAGALLARGAIDLFGGAPSDAAKTIDNAVAGTKKRLASIQKFKQAIELVGALVSVAGSLLTGDWKAVLKDLEKLGKKKSDKTKEGNT